MYGVSGTSARRHRPRQCAPRYGILGFVFGARDMVWSVVICAAALVYVQCRPAWSARRFIEREAEVGFQQAFARHRFVDGELITTVGKGAHLDPLAPVVTVHDVDITAERLAWNGKSADFVVRHRIELQDDTDASMEVHVRIEMRGSSWVYTLFEVRGAGELPQPNADNPWARALRSG